MGYLRNLVCCGLDCDVALAKWKAQSCVIVQSRCCCLVLLTGVVSAVVIVSSISSGGNSTFVVGTTVGAVTVLVVGVGVLVVSSLLCTL